MTKKKQLKVQDTIIQWQVIGEEDYICLTDMAKGFEGDPRDYIRNWLRTGATIEFLGVWEQVHNVSFNVVEFHHIKSQFTENTFLMSVKKWLELTGAIGITAKSGRYGGTYAHSDIAIQFANWLSPSFYVYLIKEFQRLKTEESNRLQLEWNTNRFISKRNYALHTDSIKQNLLPQSIYETEDQWIEYASEADLLNRAVFGIISKKWREDNPDKAKKGNMRDYANTIQLLVLSNLEAINAELIRESVSKEERFQRLCTAALHQFGIFYRDQNLIDKGFS